MGVGTFYRIGKARSVAEICSVKVGTFGRDVQNMRNPIVKKAEIKMASKI